jgi:hypothetical protein
MINERISSKNTVQEMSLPHTVKPVYKGHSWEPENVPFMSSCPFLDRLKLYSLCITMQ